MEDITRNEMRLILTLFKNPDTPHTATSMAKQLGLTSMGALKIAKHLEKQHLLLSSRLGKAIIYQLNKGNEYLERYIQFLLKREAEQAPPYIKRWVQEMKNIKNAQVALLFGSVLKKEKEASDIDVLFVVDRDHFAELKKEVEERNRINIKQLHPLYQSVEDFKSHVQDKDKVVANALQGVVVFGEEKLMEWLI